MKKVLISTFTIIFFLAFSTTLADVEIIKIDSPSKIVSLTFDADMTPRMEKGLLEGKVKSWYNEDVIRELESENVPATLFLTGMWIENYPEITRKLSENPLFELGNHSYSHGSFSGRCYGLRRIPKNSDTTEVEKTESLLNRYATKHVKLFRFPGLCSDEESRKQVESIGYTVVDGDDFGRDGFQKNPNIIVRNVLSKVKNGSIIILHMHGGPIASETAPALHEIIHELKKEGFTFVKVSELKN